MIPKFKSLTEFTDYFRNEETCRRFLDEVRFRNGDYCPFCGHGKINRFSDGKRYRCAKCKRDFYIKTKTIFADSNIPLRKWFMAIYLLSTNTKGISSIQLAKHLGVTQKTAWFMDHRIRAALKQNKGQLFGSVELDETYIGGKEKNKHFSKRTKGVQGRSTQTKTPVMGLVQRGGEIRANVIPNAKMRTLEAEIVRNVKMGTQLYTDELLSYSQIGKLYPHKAVTHRKGKYVDGDAHTNSAESFWALFKRGYHGTYHHMSAKHLQRYVDEFSYRFNRRGGTMQDIFAETVMRLSDASKLGYKKLIA